MKRPFKTIHIFGFILAALVIVFQQDTGSAATDNTVSVSGTAVKSVTPGPLLDDFRYALPMNVWSCQTGTFVSQIGDPPVANAACAVSYTNDPLITHGGTGNSLRLEYNVNAAGSYAGYVSKLGLSSLADYKSVSFWVRGTKGKELFKAELKVNLIPSDANRDHGAVYATSYIAEAEVSTDWKQVIIPLDNYANISNWSSATEFVITFEKSQSSLNGSPTQSVIYLDDITFDTASPSAVRIDYFDDLVPIDSLGGNLWAGGGGGATASFSIVPDSGPLGTGKYSLQFTFDGLLVNNTRWAAFSLPVGGGADGVQKIQHNFQGYSAISFYIRGLNSKNGVKVELHDFINPGQAYFVIPNSGDIVDQFGPFGTEWKKYIIPFSSFKNDSGVGLTSNNTIAEIVFSMDYWHTNTAGTTYFIDQIQFE